jgi:Zn-dependent protease with chaperone function
MGVGVSGRTTFFEEQARHRRRSLRFALLAALAVGLAGIPLSLMVTPVLYLAVLTAAHLLNLITPVPAPFWEAVTAAGRLLPRVFEPIDRGINQGDWSTLDWFALGRFGLGLVLPGMALMFLLWVWVRALFRRAGTGGILLSIGARDPNPRDLEEHQVVNVLQEMAIAAGLTPPALKILDQPEPNLATVGRDPQHATIVITRGLLDTLNRDETQGALGHAIGSICNGDLKIAMLLMSVNQTYGLLGTVLTAGSAKQSRRTLWRSIKGLFSRDETAIAQVAELLTREPPLEEESGRSGCLAGLRIPFMLAAASTQLLITIGQMLFFGPLLGAMWRARRYLADATSVKLTRNPDGMAHALQRLQRSQLRFARGDSAGILFLHWPATSGTGSIEPAGGWQPRVSQRVHRLEAQGANRLRFDIAGDGVATRPGLLGQILGPILMVLVYALLAVGIVAMLAGAVLTMSVTLLFVGAALFFIQGFFTILPDLVHWLRFDAVPVAQALGRALGQLIGELRR